MKTATGIHIHIHETVDALAEAFARAQTELVARAVQRQGYCALALTGGSAPAPLYARLATPEFQHAAPWEKVKIFWGDERPVGPASPDSNYKLAWDAWLSKSAIPQRLIFRMKGEADDLEEAAEEYEEILNHEVPARAGGFPSLDLIHLGLGENGHVASIFPGTAAMGETLRVAMANPVPEIDSVRLTLTFPTLNAAREVWFLVTGERKAERVAQILGFLPSTATYPASLIHHTDDRVRWWLDRAAASQIPADQLYE